MELTNDRVRVQSLATALRVCLTVMERGADVGIELPASPAEQEILDAARPLLRRCEGTAAAPTVGCPTCHARPCVCPYRGERRRVSDACESARS